MSFFNAIGLSTLLAALVGAHVHPGGVHATTTHSAVTQTAHEAHEYVFGQLRRAGDASSFVRDSRWQPLGRGGEVTLVVVPREIAPGSLRSATDLRQAQDRGQLFMIQ